MKKLFTFLFTAAVCTNVFSQKTLKVSKPITSITIDGYLDEYSWNVNKSIKNPINLESTECGIVTPGELGNNRAKFGLLWDATNLYAAITVYDNKVVASDMVNIYLSMDNDRTSNCPSNWPTAYNANTFQLMFDPSTKTLTSPQGQEMVVSEHVIRTINGGYVIEAPMAWAELDYFC